MTCLFFQFDPYRGVVAGFHPSAYVAVYPGRAQQWCHLRTQQEMVYTQAGIAAKRVAEIIPVRIYGLVGINMPDGVGPTLFGQCREHGPRFGAEIGRASWTDRDE